MDHFNGIKDDIDDREAHEMLRKMSGAGGRPQDKYTVQEKDDKFTKERGPHILGVGATATVVLAKEEATGKLVAIKIIDLLQQGDKAALLKELTVQDTHPVLGPHNLKFTCPKERISVP